METRRTAQAKAGVTGQGVELLTRLASMDAAGGRGSTLGVVGTPSSSVDRPVPHTTPTPGDGASYRSDQLRPTEVVVVDQEDPRPDVTVTLAVAAFKARLTALPFPKTPEDVDDWVERMGALLEAFDQVPQVLLWHHLVAGLPTTVDVRDGNNVQEVLAIISSRYGSVNPLETKVRQFTVAQWRASDVSPVDYVRRLRMAYKPVAHLVKEEFVIHAIMVGLKHDALLRVLRAQKPATLAAVEEVLRAPEQRGLWVSAGVSTHVRSRSERKDGGNAITASKPPPVEAGTTVSKDGPQKPLICFACNQPGHKRAACPTKPVSAVEQGTIGGTRPMFMLRVHESLETEVPAMVDTGAAVGVIMTGTLAQLRLVSHADQRHVLKNFEGQNVHTQGTVKVQLPWMAPGCLYELHVVHGDDAPILIGADAIDKLHWQRERRQLVINGWVAPVLQDTPAVVVARVEMNVDIPECSTSTVGLEADKPVVAEGDYATVKECFLQGLDGSKVLGESAGFQARWKVPDTVVNVYRPVLHPKRQEQLQQAVDQLVALDIVEESQSKWCSPVVLVPKKDGSTRFCVDYRTVNESLEDEAYPMPAVDQLLRRLRGKFFAKVDLKAGYHQVVIHHDCRDMTAFRCGRKIYRYKRLPMGLKVSPRIFQKYLESVLPTSVFIYLDDLLIAQEDWETYCEVIWVLRAALITNGLRANVEKCEFADKIAVLGHIVDAIGLHCDPSKVLVIRNLPRPKSKDETRRIVGLLGYYRKFIFRYAHWSAPIYALLQNDTAFHWREEQEKAFEMLKNALADAVTLVHPDFTVGFVLRTDASDIAVAAILGQFREGTFVPIVFYSRKLTIHEKRYDTREKELLAVITGLQQFRAYLVDCVEVQTDHKNLVWLYRQPEMGRLGRWLLTLSEFRIKWTHVPGTTLVDADCLSRVSQVNAVQQIDNPTVGDIRIAQAELKAMEDDMVKDGIVYAKVHETWVPRIPEDAPIVERFLNFAHANHRGVRNTLLQLQRMCVFPKMKQRVKAHVGACSTCVVVKQGQPHNQGTMVVWSPQRPLETVAMDVVGPLPTVTGYKYVLTIIDVFSRYLVSLPLRQQTAAEIATAFVNQWVCVFGVPVSILTDRGAAFVGSLMESLCVRLGVRHLRTSAVHPQTNGVCERVHRTMVQLLHAVTEGDVKSNWPEQLPLITFMINNSISTTTGVSPQSLMFKMKIQAPFDMYQSQQHVLEEDRKNDFTISEEFALVHERILKKMYQRKAQYDVHKKDVQWEVGMHVFVYEPGAKKLELRWTGPYKLVVQAASAVTWQVEHVQTGVRRWIHVNRLTEVPNLAMSPTIMDTFEEAHEDVCHRCGYGGQLLLCDNCSLSFHIACLELETVPEGQWFCPQCAV